MSDLSRMLDDLYALPEDGDVVTDDTPTEAPTKAPAWASAEALDEAFSSWVPGQPDGASAFERSMLDDVEDVFDGDAEPDGTDDDANDAVEQWLAESEPVPQPVRAGVPRWSPSDDDILPSRRGRRRSRR